MGETLASQCSAFLYFILNLVILETNDDLCIVSPYIQYAFIRFTGAQVNAKL